MAATCFFGVKLTLVPEDPPADTAGALKLAGPYLAERAFDAERGDFIFLDFNLLDLAAHDSHEPWLAWLALRAVDDVGRYGAVTLDGERVDHAIWRERYRVRSRHRSMAASIG